MTAPFVYLRLHGKKAEHAWDYTREELQPYVDKARSHVCVLDRLVRCTPLHPTLLLSHDHPIPHPQIVAWRKQGLDCWVYFLNDADGKAPANAFDLLAMVRAACGEPLPSRPEDKERQIMSSYFSKGKAKAPPAGGGGDGGWGLVKRGRKEEEGGEKKTSTSPSPKRPRGEKEEWKEKESGGSGSGGGEGKKGEGGGGGGKATTPKQAATAAAAAGSKPLTAFFKKADSEEGKKE